MTKVLIGAVIVILIGIGVFAVNRGGVDETMVKPEDTMMEDANPTTSENVMMEDKKDEGTMMTKGSYEAYAPEKLAKAADGDVVLFFRASWCPTCRAADADIRANLDEIPSNLTILDVNYDSATALKQRYGVTYQHTFVQVDSMGNQLARWTGSLTLADIVANVK